MSDITTKKVLKDWFLDGNGGLRLEAELTDGTTQVVELSLHAFDQLDLMATTGAPVGAKLSSLLKPHGIEVPERFYDC